MFNNKLSIKYTDISAEMSSRSRAWVTDFTELVKLRQQVGHLLRNFREGYAAAVEAFDQPHEALDVYFVPTCEEIIDCTILT